MIPSHHPTNGGIPFLVLLLAADAAFLVLHLLHASLGLPEDGQYRVDRDGGYPEVFQYLKNFWAVVMLGVVAARERRPGYLPWALMFAYLLADDALQIHERAGRVMPWGLNAVLGLEGVPRGLCELALSASVGAVLLAPIALAYLRGDDRARGVHRNLFMALACIAFFGVAVDWVHTAADRGSALYEAMAVLEDGGEMIAVSLACWYVFNLWAGPDPAPSRAVPAFDSARSFHPALRAE